MPIKFISLSETFTKAMILNGYEAYTMKIEDYQPSKTNKTYYVSPANSIGFMDGGIDYALSRHVFPGIEKQVKKAIHTIGHKNLVEQCYLPIGSSIIITQPNETMKALIVAPTMLLPQNVSETTNAYYATMAILYNIYCNEHENEDESTIDILFTSLCCGYGRMKEEECIIQILAGIEDYKQYKPSIVCKSLSQGLYSLVLHEPTLFFQPKYYQNISFFDIDPNEIQLIPL